MLSNKDVLYMPLLDSFELLQKDKPPHCGDAILSLDWGWVKMSS